MAKWGRKGWLFRTVGRNRQMWSSSPFKRVKTVSWGSNRTAPSSNKAKAWGSGRTATSSSNKAKAWGSGRTASSSSNKAKAWGGKWQPRAASSSGPRPWSRVKPQRSRAVKASPSKPGLTGGWGSRPSVPRSRWKMWVGIILLVAIIGSIQSFIYIEKHLRPPLMKVAQIRIKQVATQAINKATTEQVVSHSEFEKLIDWKMNSGGKVSGFMLNYAEHTKIRAQTINIVQSTLNELKEIPEHIPIGNALGSAIISSYGPRVPVKFEPVGAVKVDLNTRQKDAGINMILIEVYIKIVAEVAIIIPFETEPQLVETEIPISYLLVVGDVPMYYYDNKGNPVGDSANNAPNISVPLSDGEGVTKSSDGSMIEEHLDTSTNPLPQEGQSDPGNAANTLGNTGEQTGLD